MVEDYISLMVVGKKHSTLALLGTSLTKDRIPPILEHLIYLQPKSVIVALDPDANYKAQVMARDLTQYWEGVKSVTTANDPKYWNDNEIESYTK